MDSVLVNDRHHEALALHHAGRYQEAEQAYLAALQTAPDNDDLWRNLGMLYYAIDRHQEAEQALLEALKLDDTKAAQHYSLGLVAQKLGKLPLALHAYQAAITLEPSFVDAYTNLAGLLVTLNQLEQAEALYQQAITHDPKHTGSHLNLGNLLLQRGQLEAAIASYQQAFQLDSTNSDILYNLGIAFDAKQSHDLAAFCFAYAAFYQKQYAEAIPFYQQVLPTQVSTPQLYVDLVECYKQINQPEESIQTCQAGLKHYPANAQLYLKLIDTLQYFERTEAAIAVADQAAALLPTEMALQFNKCVILPILYDTSEQVLAYRQRFQQELDQLSHNLRLDGEEQRQSALWATAHYTPFYLQYQGYNDVALQQQYGQLIHQVMAANYPDWCQPQPMPDLAPGEKIRVVYVSDCMRFHTVGTMLLGWLRHADRAKFQIFSYAVYPQTDHITQQFRLYSDYFHHLPSGLEAVLQQVLIDRPHVLVFPSIGMFPPINQMASLRLAPIQCTSWLHPVTSGLPTIDYFLSSDLMEPENAQAHYSEQLIRLPNLGIAYAKPPVPALTKTRQDFQLRERTIVYLCSQSLFKYLPAYDYIFAAIAQRLPQAQFAFIEHPSQQISDRFRLRLERAFFSVGLSSQDYCTFLPRQTTEDYLQLNQLADIFLDSFAWSGGGTTLEAIACNLPIVTCPGELMRGRHSSGILQALGVTATIAHDAQDYINIAVRLAKDLDWRLAIITAMQQRHDRLYDDVTCVRALEDFYQRKVNESLNKKLLNCDQSLRN